MLFAKKRFGCGEPRHRILVEDTRDQDSVDVAYRYPKQPENLLTLLAVRAQHRRDLRFPHSPENTT